MKRCNGALGEDEKSYLLGL